MKPGRKSGLRNTDWRKSHLVERDLNSGLPTGLALDLARTRTQIEGKALLAYPQEVWGLGATRSHQKKSTGQEGLLSHLLNIYQKLDSGKQAT